MSHFEDDILPPPPPGFRPLDPHRSVERYERHLPHWRQSGVTYFVTFRLGDSLPQDKLRVLDDLRREWLSVPADAKTDQRAREYAKAVFESVERWLDAGWGACWFGQPRYAMELHRAILHYHTARHFAAAGVIMPNHCHLVVRPFDSFDLEDLLGGIKCTVARFINRETRNTGAVWQQESYDRIIRDTAHLHNVVQYIGRNPARAGLPRDQWCRWIDPSWQSDGWRFVDED